MRPRSPTLTASSGAGPHVQPCRLTSGQRPPGGQPTEPQVRAVGHRPEPTRAVPHSETCRSVPRVPAGTGRPGTAPRRTPAAFPAGPRSVGPWRCRETPEAGPGRTGVLGTACAPPARARRWSRATSLSGARDSASAPTGGAPTQKTEPAAQRQRRGQASDPVLPMLSSSACWPGNTACRDSAFRQATAGVVGGPCPPCVWTP